jgi:hypothetical protein
MFALGLSILPWYILHRKSGSFDIKLLKAVFNFVIRLIKKFDILTLRRTNEHTSQG